MLIGWQCLRMHTSCRNWRMFLQTPGWSHQSRKVIHTLLLCNLVTQTCQISHQIYINQISKFAYYFRRCRTDIESNAGYVLEQHDKNAHAGNMYPCCCVGKSHNKLQVVVNRTFHNSIKSRFAGCFVDDHGIKQGYLILSPRFFWVILFKDSEHSLSFHMKAPLQCWKNGFNVSCFCSHRSLFDTKLIFQTIAHVIILVVFPSVFASQMHPWTMLTCEIQNINNIMSMHRVHFITNTIRAKSLHV